MIKKIMLIVLVLEAALMAHAGMGSVSGLQDGLTHPLHGSDHIVTMLAVGFWAAQMGGRALWAVPVSFMGMMSVGAMIGLQGMHVPYVEEAITVSVLLLGVFIVMKLNVSVALSTVTVALFALFHGFAHVSEMPLNIGGLAYATGFTVTTGILHLLGIMAAVGVQKISTYRQMHGTVMEN